MDGTPLCPGRKKGRKTGRKEYRIPEGKKEYRIVLQKLKVPEVFSSDPCEKESGEIWSKPVFATKALDEI